MTIASIYRTHSCGELRAENIGLSVKLSGWIKTKRDHGGVVFLDLRDHYGVTQIVISGAAAESLPRVESVVAVSGTVVARRANACNKDLSTGDIEIDATDLEVLSEAAVLPFPLNVVDQELPESLRLKYRYLDLRNDKLHEHIMLRSKVISDIRTSMHNMGFKEFQTPILTASSPEGARDFLVPSRVHKGQFFALPQAPQQFKQLLMVAGFDRYFQIAPCFRDEDPRADRSPGEFYQVDMEMSFVEQEDVFKVGERLFYEVFTANTTKQVTQAPFPRIPYDDAMTKYGSDKPDLRIQGEILDIATALKNNDFGPFREATSANLPVWALVIPCREKLSRKAIDKLVAWYRGTFKSEIGYVSLMSGTGSLGKFFSENEIAAVKELAYGRGVIDGNPSEESDILAFVVAATPVAGRYSLNENLGKLRALIGQEYQDLDSEGYKFCWIIDYPMYELNPMGELDFSHNPFSMPQGGLAALEVEDPLEIKASQYDIVCNGYELSSGAVRNHLPEIMYKVFGIVGYSKDEVESQFGGLLTAFKYGAPPHGGMAPGVDRIVMLLAGEQVIREVIAFPLTQNVQDLMMGAPRPASVDQLRELGLRVIQD